ncbi:hypothetical protein [Actinotalea ferrariae]|nr:hypothetical protein [Actinotalea ferrariae]
MENTVTPPPFELSRATWMEGEIVFGDSGVGGIPLDGDIVLSVDGGRSWRGKLSTSALEAVEQQLWAHREQAQGVTEAEALAIARAAFGYELAFFGLDADWDSASLAVSATRHVVSVSVAAPVRWAELFEPDVRMAMVRLEISTGEVNFAEFVLSDPEEHDVFAREELDPGSHASPSLDSMTWFCLSSLGECLAARGLPAVSDWHVGYDQFPGAGGWSAELRVWALVSVPDAAA